MNENRWQALARGLAWDRRMWHTYSRYEGKWWAKLWRLWFLAKGYARLIVTGRFGSSVESN